MGENVKEEEKKGPTARQVGGTYQRHQNSLPEDMIQQDERPPMVINLQGFWWK